MIQTNEWIPCAVQLPLEKVVVKTKIDDKDGVRNEGSLMRRGRFWFPPDGVMYVYYTPTHWKLIHDCD